MTIDPASTKSSGLALTSIPWGWRCIRRNLANRFFVSHGGPPSAWRGIGDGLRSGWDESRRVWWARRWIGGAHERFVGGRRSGY